MAGHFFGRLVAKIDTALAAGTALQPRGVAKALDCAFRLSVGATIEDLHGCDEPLTPQEPLKARDSVLLEEEGLWSGFFCWFPRAGHQAQTACTPSGARYLVRSRVTPCSSQ